MSVVVWNSEPPIPGMKIKGVLVGGGVWSVRMK